MDEATSALDEANQAAMFALLDGELAGSAVVSIGHRPGLAAYHDRVLAMVPGPGGARLTAVPPRLPASPGLPRRYAAASGRRALNPRQAIPSAG
jgi:putative ATP-binding cassette transporter